MTDAFGRTLEEFRQLLQRIAAVDASGGIVRRIDNDESRSRADRRVDRVQVEIERRSLESNLAHHGSAGQQQRFIAEPCRLAEYGFIAGVQDPMKSNHDGSKRTVSERDIGCIECQTQFAPNMLSKERLRLLFARFVSKPVLVVGHCTLADSRHQTRQRHLMRIAEGEVRKDRKSTRLNSSHSQISYAVFCLKKK